MIVATILIAGYYGFNNAGDDAVLYGIITSLRRFDPTVQCRVLSNQPRHTRALFHIPAYDRWNPWIIFRQIKQADMLVMGGGGLLQDVTSPRSILYYLGVVQIAKWLKKPVVFYAQGFGPVQRPLSKWLIRRILNDIDLITVRDHGSREDFVRTGVTRPPVLVTADPAMAIDPSEVDGEAGRAVLARHRVRSSRVAVVSVREWPASKVPYKKVFARCLRRLVDRGWHIVFVPMQHPKDVAPSKEIAEQLGEHATVIDAPLTFFDIMNIIKASQMVVGMRLHSLILAALLSVPAVAFSYDQKIERFARRVGIPCAGSTDCVDEAAFCQTLVACSENLEEARAAMKPGVEEMRRFAMETARRTIDILHRRQR
ncbi:MAG: polysaccharide pyruvyl transferase CsaB [Alicyclobacillaceae bacterium]|nr:polysaccharide pyruvyl transferase CsaB [Alicyclobacillaceae bacterium]